MGMDKDSDSVHVVETLMGIVGFTGVELELGTVAFPGVDEDSDSVHVVEELLGTVGLTGVQDMLGTVGLTAVENDQVEGDCNG
jgi:hypothetical protein